MKKTRMLSLLLAVLFFGVFQVSSFGGEYELSWTPATDTEVIGYEISYRLDDGHTEPFNGTGLSIGDSPVKLGNVTSVTLEPVPDSSEICLSIRAYKSDGEMGPYSQIVCGKIAASSNTYTIWGENKNPINLGSKTETGTCVPVIDVNGQLFQGSETYYLTNFSGGESDTVTFQRAPGDIVLYTQQAEGGTIYPIDYITSFIGERMEVHTTPDFGKCLTGMYDNEMDVFDQVIDGFYSIDSPAESHIIRPVFGSCYSVTASTTGNGGSITPSFVALDYMGSTTLNIAASEGYYLAELKDNGVSVIDQVFSDQYTVSYANENHTVVATFAMIEIAYIPQSGDKSLTADVNGDGKKDSIIFALNGSWYVSLSTGGSFGYSLGTYTKWISGHGSGSTRQLLADVNNDGKADAVVFFSDGRWYVSLSTGNSFGSYTQWISGHGSGSTRQLLADVNNDGKADAVVFFSDGRWYVSLSTGSSFSSYTQWIGGHGGGSANQMLADVNNDGKADAVVFFSDGRWYVSLSTGSSFGSYTQWISGHGSGSVNQMLADVNNDKKADAVVFFSDGRWYVSLSTGNSFGSYTQWISGHGSGSVNQMLADVNNDKKADAVVFFSDGRWYVSLSTGSNFSSYTRWK